MATTLTVGCGVLRVVVTSDDILVTSTVAPTLDKTEDTNESEVSADTILSEYEVDESKVVSDKGDFTVNATFHV
jgi:hypothetical protein